MYAVIEYIDRHLDQDLDLATLAGVAHFSAFHFHRVFRAWTGEVLGDYLRRRRLEMGSEDGTLHLRHLRGRQSVDRGLVLTHLQENAARGRRL